MDAPNRGAARGPGWRLVVGTLGFAIWAPLSMATLPGAALLAATGGAPRNRIAAALLGAVSAGLLVGSPAGRLDAVTRAFTVFVAVALFAVVQLQAEPPTFLRPTLRAIGIAGVATALLVPAMWGTDAWSVLAWDKERAVGLTMRFFVELQPRLIGVYEPVVRVVTFATPFTLALKAGVGIAVAWGWHRWMTSETATPEALLTSTQ